MRTARTRTRLAVVLAALTAAGGTVAAQGLAVSAPRAEAGTAPSTQGWQATPVPVEKGDISAVAALSDRDAWAVGYRLKDTNELEPLALRWNGESWQQESTLPADSTPQILSVRAADDIWAAGTDTAHWDGKTWTGHALETPDNTRVMPNGLATAGNGRAWVVGEMITDSVKDSVPVVHAWDGAAWHRQQLPDVGKGELEGVSVLAPNDVWAAGFTEATAPDAPQATLVLHWDGNSWQRIPSPNVDRDQTWINGLTAFGSGDVWAVGATIVNDIDQPFAMHWDGRSWAVASTPALSGGRLLGVGRTSSGDLWALGGSGAVSVALRWNWLLHSWERALDPGIVLRSFTTVAGSGALWAVGIAKQGDLVPAVSRYGP